MTSSHPVFGTRILGRTYQPRPGSYVIIEDEAGRIALVSTPLGVFLPGGGQDPGETHEETIRREVIEECGRIVEVTSPLGRADHYLWSPKEGAFYCKECSFFTGRIVGEAEPVEIDHELIWREPQETWSLLPASQRWAVQRYVQTRRSQTYRQSNLESNSKAAAETNAESDARTVTVRMAGPADAGRLTRVHPDVFDHELHNQWTQEFLQDERHHLAIAVADEAPGGLTLGGADAMLSRDSHRALDQIVGMASAVHYVHPDKPAELWINEVGVATPYRGQHIGRRLIETLLSHARDLGIQTAWVLTDPDNSAAQNLYESTGAQRTPTLMYTYRLR